MHLSVYRGGGVGSHVTITHDALDLTVPIPPLTYDLLTYTPPPEIDLLLTSGGDHMYS